jgi:hypothetical protein
MEIISEEYNRRKLSRSLWKDSYYAKVTGDWEYTKRKDS